jgi:hypothetical protein
MKPTLNLLSALFLAPLLPLTAAELKLASVLADHMVLQRDKPVPVWGTADAGETVSVTFGAQTLSTVAAPDGRWSLTLAPLAANATPATLTLKGKNTIVLQDIVVGEVWLASGQSNMEWSLSRSYDPDLEQLTARFPLIREIKVKRRTASAPMAGFEGEWKSATSANVAQFKSDTVSDLKADAERAEAAGRGLVAVTESLSPSGAGAATSAPALVTAIRGGGGRSAIAPAVQVALPPPSLAGAVVGSGGGGGGGGGGSGGGGGGGRPVQLGLERLYAASGMARRVAELLEAGAVPEDNLRLVEESLGLALQAAGGKRRIEFVPDGGGRGGG